MKDKVKGLVLGVLIGSLITGGSVFAASSTKIEVIYENLKYIVNGVEKKPTTGQGFIYQGTTYVPLRFAGEALGEEVYWDGKTKTITIGEKKGTFKYITDLEYARAEGYAKDNLFFKQWKYPAGYTFHIAGTEYLNGMGIVLYSDRSGKVSYNLNGKYSSLSTLVGIDDYTKNSRTFGRVTIIGDGNELYRSHDLIGGELAEEIKVDLTGVLKLEILFEAFESYDQLDIVLAETKLYK